VTGYFFNVNIIRRLDMHNIFTAALVEKIEKSGVIAVLVIDRAEDAVPLAEALLEGGISMMELTLRTPAALAALDKIKRNVPEMSAGIGTVLNVGQLKDVKSAGAEFAVSPGFNPRVVKAALDMKFPFAPGISTPSDIEGALELGCRLLKFFPAETGDGMKHLKSMAAPYMHLGLKFIPLGGLSPHNMPSYLESPLIAAVGGSWLAKRDVIKANDWKTIKNNALKASEAVSKIRGIK
jgi:2-dehydro-3-deoxyphosphogluconate aldolase/(4S)-4-hydroxy-2-oxoglutarate aldolase